jgi:hypothetical protein
VGAPAPAELCHGMPPEYPGGASVSNAVSVRTRFVSTQDSHKEQGLAEQGPIYPNRLKAA